MPTQFCNWYRLQESMGFTSPFQGLRLWLHQEAPPPGGVCQCFYECGHQSSSISSTRALVRNTNPLAPPQTHWPEILEEGTRTWVFTSLLDYPNAAKIWEANNMTHDGKWIKAASFVQTYRNTFKYIILEIPLLVLRLYDSFESQRLLGWFNQHFYSIL